MLPVVEVAAAALVDPQGRILLARRPEHVHQGGLWEFPGGKMELGETPAEALVRELHEELGIHTGEFRPLIRLAHRYPDREVILHVFRVQSWSGEPHGREGQPLAWVAEDELLEYPMPAADKPIVSALRLPERYVITPPRIHDVNRFLQAFESLLDGGVRLLQYRVFDTGGDLTPAQLLQELQQRAGSAGAVLMVNDELADSAEAPATGIHLSGRHLYACSERPREAEWVAASCHSAADLHRAESLGLDFAVLSPVLPTRSHPDAEPLWWQGFADRVRDAGIPVYALGGMHAGLLDQAWTSGAQGIAGIRGFWGHDQI